MTKKIKLAKQFFYIYNRSRIIVCKVLKQQHSDLVLSITHSPSGAVSDAAPVCVCFCVCVSAAGVAN